MTRWQRFKHLFERCRGPLCSKQYFAPRSVEFKGWAPSSLLEEALYGVTLFHYKCSKCGDRFTNRRIGDWREESCN